MQAETLAKIDTIKSAVGLLRKHVKYDEAKARLVDLEVINQSDVEKCFTQCAVVSYLMIRGIFYSFRDGSMSSCCDGRCGLYT